MSRLQNESELIPTGKQGYKYGTIYVPIYPVVLMYVLSPTFWIITQEVFIVRHLFKHSRIPKKIRNRSIPRRVGIRLNFLIATMKL